MAKSARQNPILTSVALAVLALVVVTLPQPIAHAETTVSKVNLQLFKRSEIDRDRGCSIALWQANRDPYDDKYAYIFFEQLRGDDNQRDRAEIKIDNEIVKLARIAKGGRKYGYGLYEYQLYRFLRKRHYVILDLKLREEGDEAVEITKGKLTVVMHGKKVFRSSVRGNAGCMSSPID